VQFSKTRLPILLTLEGTVNEFRLVQSEKAANPIDVIFPLNETEFKLEQLLNVASTISETINEHDSKNAPNVGDGVLDVPTK
jgi:hypothetical protein